MHNNQLVPTGENRYLQITNGQFLQAIFGEHWVTVHITGFPDDPSDIQQDRRAICWGGGHACQFGISDDWNNYFTISRFELDADNKPRRRKNLFLATYVIVADDVKEKLPVEQVNLLPPPSYKLLTSPGSEQWGWILNVPCTDAAVVNNLLDGLVAKGLAPSGTDPGMKGVTRYVRLPKGVNSKRSRVEANGGFAPRCQLLEWNPERKHTIESLAIPFSIDLTAERKDARTDGATNLPDHPILQIPGIIHVKSILSPGRYDIRCPWTSDHTNGEDTGAALFTNDDGTIGFKCHHGNCESRNRNDLLTYIDQYNKDFRDKLKMYEANIMFAGMGEITVTLPPESADPIQVIQDPVQPEGEQSAKRWPEKISDDGMPGLLGEFVREVTQNSEADPAAVLSQFLVQFGIECGSKPHFKIGESRHSVRENVVVVGETSKGRKGTSAAPVAAIFKKIMSPCNVSPGPLPSGEGIIYAVRDETPEWRINRRTGEGSWVITDPGVSDKRLLVIEEEFASALQSSKREGNTLSSILRTLYDSGKASPLTKSSRIQCTDAHVGVVAHITRFELNKLLTDNDKFNGFGNRFLWICSRRTKLVPFPEPLPEVLKQKMVDHLDRVIIKARGGQQYLLSPPAKELWGNVYPDLTEARDGVAGAMVGRSEAHVMRLSLIYCLFRGGDQIETEDLNAALAFWKYADQSANYIFGGAVVPDRRRQKILEYIGSGEKTKTEIRNEAFSGHITKEELDTLLGDLENNEIIDSEVVATAGAPKTVFRKRSCVLSIKSVITQIGEKDSMLNTHNTPDQFISAVNQPITCTLPPPPVPQPTGVPA